MKTRTVISKSAKRKMTNGNNVKACAFTEMVVYREKLPNGNYTSRTKHEVSAKF